MKTAIPKPLRCAIYTRKSTEHNLDLAFNSLDVLIPGQAAHRFRDDGAPLLRSIAAQHSD
jgi:hypothetical protein